MLKSFRKKIIAVFGVFTFLFTVNVSTAPMASAHVTAQLYGSTAKANGYGHLFFRVPHAAKDKSTTKLSIEIPAGVTAVKPEHKAGWVESVTYASDNVTPIEVSWSGGNLPDTSFMDFGVSLKYPNNPGSTLYFKAVQTLNDGSTVAWIEIPMEGVDSHSLSKPAPSVKLEATQATHGEADHSKDDHAAMVKNGVSGDFLVKLTGNKARLIVDLSSVNSGQSVKVHLKRSGKDVLLYSGKLDMRGDVFVNIASQSASGSKYKLKKGDSLHLYLGGKMILEGKIS